MSIRLLCASTLSLVIGAACFAETKPLDGLCGVPRVAEAKPTTVHDGIPALLIQYDRSGFMLAKSQDDLRKAVHSVKSFANYADAIEEQHKVETPEFIYQVVGLTQLHKMKLPTLTAHYSNSRPVPFEAGSVRGDALDLVILDRKSAVGMTEGGNGSGGDNRIGFSIGQRASRSLDLQILDRRSPAGATEGGNGGGDMAYQIGPRLGAKIDIQIVSRGSPDGATSGGNGGGGDMRYQSREHRFGRLDLGILDRRSPIGSTDGGNGSGGGDMLFSGGVHTRSGIDLVTLDRSSRAGMTDGGNGSGGSGGDNRVNTFSAATQGLARSGYALLLRGGAATNLKTYADALARYPGANEIMKSPTQNPPSAEMASVPEIENRPLIRSRPLISESGLTIWSFPGNQFPEGTGAFSQKTTRGKYLVPKPIDFHFAAVFPKEEDARHFVEHASVNREEIFWEGRVD